jgi:hypothetical protein
MLSLMLDLRFKNLCLILFFFTMKKVWLLLENINKRSICPMLLKCYHHSHLVAEFEVGCANQVIDENCNLWHFNKLLGQMSKWKNLLPKSCWFLNITKWIRKKSIVLFNGGDAWSHDLYYWFSSTPNPKHFKITNWDWEDFLFSGHTY